MRALLVGLGIVVGAFAVGVSGLPGFAMSTAATWLQDNGRLELHGPVGDAVKQAL